MVQLIHCLFTIQLSIQLLNFISGFFSDHAIAPKIINSQHVAHEFDVEFLQPFIVSTDTTPNIMTL